MAEPEAAEATPDPPGPPPGADLPALAEAVEHWLLRGTREYTREDVVQRVDITADEARALWRALGFATVADDERVFTNADLDALRNVRQLEQVGEIDDEMMRAMTRIIGQSFARLASWQGQLVVELIAARPELLSDGSPEHVLTLLGEITPLVAELQDYVWRRQLAAYFSRVAATAAGGSSERGTECAAVGFADMAQFTTFTRRSTEADLRAVLDDFEALATEVVADNHGQIVKTIGDEVLFVADGAADAARIATALVERAEASDTLPSLRAGVAFGPVVRRLGDVYGQTVNIASRLVSIARAGSVVIDEQLADEIDGDPEWVVHAMRPLSVRGYRHLRAARLRRSQD